MVEFGEDYVFNSYISTLERYQHLADLLSGSQAIDYFTILQELIECKGKVENIIILETNTKSYLLELFELRHQMDFLIEMIEHKLKRREVTHFNKNESNFADHVPVKRWSEEPNTSQSFKKTKREDDTALQGLIQSTIERPKVTGLKEIVGLRDIKKSLKSLIILPKTQPQLFENRKICNTILLFGPPGTGKTRLVHALAAEAEATLHCITAGDVLSQYVGQTEKTIKALFQHLKTCRYFAILFIDEIDAFCRKRTEGEQEHTRRIKTELMCQMSSIEDCKNVFVVCATNCPWDLDSAIMRRFQKRIYVPLPCEFERLEFFKFFTRNESLVNNSDDWLPLLQRTDGYSGSDLSDIVQNALNIPITELEDAKIWKLGADGFYEPILCGTDFSDIICSDLSDLPVNSVRARKVQMIDLLSAVDSVMCTVSRSDIQKYENFNGNYIE